jgi:hypothetical protein
MAAHNWRTIRQRYADKGIADPMSLPSMHHVLDTAENLALESATAGAKTKMEAERGVSSVYTRLYRPDLTEEISAINGSDEELLRPPPGFEDDEVEASFDAFVASASAR